MSKLLYLTDRWPFPAGESFVTREIRDLAPYFEEILLLPTSLEPLGDAVRPLPDNARVLEDVHAAIAERWAGRGFLKRLSTGLGMPGVMGEILSSRPLRPREVIGEAAQIRLAADLIESMVDLSHVDAVAAFWLNRGASIAAELKRRNPRLAAHARGHGGDIYARRRGMRHLPMQRPALRALDAIWPDSEAGVQHLAKKYPEIASKVAVGRLGVDDQEMSASSDDGRLHILSVASLLPVKRVHLLAESLRSVERPTKWTHIGGGETLAEVQSALQGVGDHIEIDLKGQIPHEEVLAWFKENPVDVFVNTSSSEGLPVSIMEAFSYGIPVIATAVGGSPEIVSEDCGALLDPDFKPAELSAVLNEWAHDESRREAAHQKQRTAYSSVRNQAAFAAEMLR